jgi:hypothetical protein
LGRRGGDSPRAVLVDIMGIVILAAMVAIVGGGAFSLGPVLKLCLAALAFLAAGPVLSRKASARRPLDQSLHSRAWLAPLSLHRGGPGSRSTIGCDGVHGCAPRGR